MYRPTLRQAVGETTKKARILTFLNGIRLAEKRESPGGSSASGAFSACAGAMAAYLRSVILMLFENVRPLSCPMMEIVAK